MAAGGSLGAFKVRWHGPKVNGKLRSAGYRGLRMAADHCRTRIVRLLGISAILTRGAVSPSAKSRRKPRRYRHSKPGEPPRSITGKLRQSIYSRAERRKMASEVGTASKVGRYLEGGTGASIIRPTRKRRLVFGGWVERQAEYTKRGKVKKQKGHRMEWGWVFAREVHHPGIKKRPFIWVTVKQEKSRLHGIIAGEMRRAMAPTREAPRVRPA